MIGGRVSVVSAQYREPSACESRGHATASRGGVTRCARAAEAHGYGGLSGLRALAVARGARTRSSCAERSRSAGVAREDLRRDPDVLEEEAARVLPSDAELRAERVHAHPGIGGETRGGVGHARVDGLRAPAPARERLDQPPGVVDGCRVDESALELVRGGAEDRDCVDGLVGEAMRRLAKEDDSAPGSEAHRCVSGRPTSLDPERPGHRADHLEPAGRRVEDRIDAAVGVHRMRPAGAGRDLRRPVALHEGRERARRVLAVAPRHRTPVRRARSHRNVFHPFKTGLLRAGRLRAIPDREETR